MTPLLSVIIPVWCRPEKIRRAIASVTSSPQIEVIVVDDGSPDNTAQAAREAMSHAGHSGQVLVQPNSGPGAARNTGADTAIGRYIAFLDSDDVWFPHTLPNLLDTLAHPEAKALNFLQNTTFEADEMPPHPIGGNSTLSHYVGFRDAALHARDIRLGSGCCVILRELFQAHGGFDPDLRASEDTDLFLRLPADCGCDLLRDAPLVGIEAGADDRLSTDLEQMRIGLAHLLAQARKGAYPNSADPHLARILAQSISYTTRKAFGAGRPGMAYALYFRHLPKLLRAHAWHWTIRLPLLPLLSVLRPGRYALK